jgi:hypothetical protein
MTASLFVETFSVEKAHFRVRKDEKEEKQLEAQVARS